MTNTITEPRWHKESYECSEMKISVIYNYYSSSEPVTDEEDEL